MVNINTIKIIASKLGWNVNIDNKSAEFLKPSPMNDNFGFKVPYHDSVDLLENINGYVYAFNKETYLSSLLETNKNEFVNPKMFDAYIVDSMIIKKMLEELNTKLQELE